MKLDTAEQPVSKMIAPPAQTLVLLCEALRKLGNGLDLDGIEQSLASTPGVRVEIVSDLCDNPKALAEAAVEADDRVVLGLCSSDRSVRTFDHHARQAGFDSFGVGSVNLGGLCARALQGDLAIGRALVLLAAAVAKARKFAGSGPEHMKPHLGWSEGRMSRRALFTVPPITYQPVASVRADRCISEVGCDLCTAVCPRNALSVVEGNLSVDKSACDACGLCVTECPRSAIELPTASLVEFEAELEVLLTAPGLSPAEPRAILFVCDGNRQKLEELTRKGRSLPAGWLPLHVPCTGMVTAGWVLQSLTLGASAVGILACGGECKFKQEQRTFAIVDYCQKLLQLVGNEKAESRVFMSTSLTGLAEMLEQPLDASAVAQTAQRRPHLREPLATTEALALLTELDGAATPVLYHERSPLGIVRIDSTACTGCEACVRACPTEALSFGGEDDSLEIAFDPGRCTGCGLCARFCPEDIVQVANTTDLQALSEGRTVMYRDSQARCERCGKGFAPASMVRRVEELLQDGHALSQAIRRCPSCRGFGISAALGSHVQSDQEQED